MNPAKALYRPQEATDCLSIGRTTLYRWIAKGDIETVRVGGIQFIPARAIETYAAPKIPEA